MFGKNEIQAPFNREGDKLLVHSIFYTIQGEGPDAGCPAVFIRLAKCNLRCFFCDTEFDHGEEMQMRDLARKANDLAQGRTDLVVITGGEPMLQNIIPLVAELNNGYLMRVSVETAGTLYLENMEHYFGPARLGAANDNKIVCSPKTPTINNHVAYLIHSVKYLISASDEFDEEDGLPIMQTQRNTKAAKLWRPNNPLFVDPKKPMKRGQIARPLIYVQPLDVQDEFLNNENARKAAEIAMKYGYRVSIQMHKLLDLP